MLVISRKAGERIKINDDITVTVLEVRGNNTRFGIDAPKEISVHREEIYQKIKENPEKIHNTGG